MVVKTCNVIEQEYGDHGYIDVIFLQESQTN